MERLELDVSVLLAVAAQCFCITCDCMSGIL